MELKKTTVISALVCVAGTLAEIIFRDTMSKSIFGVVLSIILAIVILVAAYFVIDGIRNFWLLEKEKEYEREKEYEQRLYGVLNEQLHFQKEIYRGVYATQRPGNLFEEPNPEPEKESDVSNEELITAINDNTMVAAKTVARYVNKNTTELKSLFDANQSDTQELLRAIAANQERLIELTESLQKNH